MPNFIRTILGAPAISVLARVLLTFMFWSGGVAALFDFRSFAGAMAMYGFANVTLVTVAVIVTDLVGSFLLITNFRGLGWLGAGALGVFTVLTIPVAHAFWAMTGPKQIEEIAIVTEHLSIVGGLLLAAIMTLPPQARSTDK